MILTPTNFHGYSWSRLWSLGLCSLEWIGTAKKWNALWPRYTLFSLSYTQEQFHVFHKIWTRRLKFGVGFRPKFILVFIKKEEYVHVFCKKLGIGVKPASFLKMFPFLILMIFGYFCFLYKKCFRFWTRSLSVS